MCVFVCGELLEFHLFFSPYSTIFFLSPFNFHLTLPPSGFYF